MSSLIHSTTLRNSGSFPFSFGFSFGSPTTPPTRVAHVTIGGNNPPSPQFHPLVQYFCIYRVPPIAQLRSTTTESTTTESTTPCSLKHAEVLWYATVEWSLNSAASLLSSEETRFSNTLLLVTHPSLEESTTLKYKGTSQWNNSEPESNLSMVLAVNPNPCSSTSFPPELTFSLRFPHACA